MLHYYGLAKVGDSSLCRPWAMLQTLGVVKPKVNTEQLSDEWNFTFSVAIKVIVLAAYYNFPSSPKPFLCRQKGGSCKMRGSPYITG